MIPLYPLRFCLLVRRYLWGGRRLETCLGKAIGPGNDYAESWEIADHGADQSIVDGGPLAGATLGELVRSRGPELLGRHHPQSSFPLLVKFLDAAQSLSVQVHPNDEQAARLNPPDLGKTEAWYILAADPGSTIYAGLQPGVDRRQLYDAIGRGTCEQLLHHFQPKAGDCLFIPAGTVHAPVRACWSRRYSSPAIPRSASMIGTVRLLTASLAHCTSRPAWQSLISSVARSIPWHLGLPSRPWVSQLVACEKFTIDRWDFDQPQVIGGDDRFHIICVIQGAIRLERDPENTPLHQGETTLLPASLGGIKLVPQQRTVLLDAYLS